MKSWKPNYRLHWISICPEQIIGYKPTPHGIILMQYDLPHGQLPGYASVDIVIGCKHYRDSAYGIFTKNMLSRMANQLIERIMTES